MGGDEYEKERWKECPRNAKGACKAEGLKDEHEDAELFHPADPRSS
ncbi:MAG: hypothetical protein R2818_04175 [Flavobacteriales bacterium]